MLSLVTASRAEGGIIIFPPVSTSCLESPEKYRLVTMTTTLVTMTTTLVTMTTTLVAMTTALVIMKIQLTRHERYWITLVVVLERNVGH